MSEIIEKPMSERLTMKNYEAIAEEDLVQYKEYIISNYPTTSITNAQMEFALTCKRLFMAGETFVCIDDGEYAKGTTYTIVEIDGVKSWEALSASSENFAKTDEENTFTAKQNFSAETQFDGVAEHNADIKVNNSVIKVLDNTETEDGTQKDLVTQYGADEIVVEQNGETYNLELPKKSGTFALDSDMPIKTLYCTYASPVDVYTEMAEPGFYLIKSNTTHGVWLKKDNDGGKIAIGVPQALIFSEGNPDPEGTGNFPIYIHGINLGWASTDELLDCYPGASSKLTFDENGFTTFPVESTVGIASINGRVLFHPRGIYAPLTSGTSGQILQSNGEQTAPTWTDLDLPTATDITTGEIAEQDFKGTVLLTAEQMETLNSEGSITIGETTYTDDGSVLFLTEDEGTQSDDALLYTAQELTEEEQAQVCSNLDLENKFVKAQVANSGELKVYCINGTNPHDVCLVTNVGKANSIARYATSGQLKSTVDPVDDTDLVRLNYIKNKLNHQQVYFGTTLPSSGLGTTYLENDVFILNNSNGTKNFYQAQLITGGNTNLAWVDIVDFEKPKWQVVAPSDTSQVLMTEVTIVTSDVTNFTGMDGKKVTVNGYTADGFSAGTVVCDEIDGDIPYSPAFIGSMTSTRASGVFVKGGSVTIVNVDNPEVTFTYKYLW